MSGDETPGEPMIGAAAPERIVWRGEIDSTNAEALRLAAAGEAGPLWIAAERQSAGRGRRGRRWESAPGALFASLLLRPAAMRPDAGSAAPLLSFAAALAVCDACADLNREAAPALAVKWPNDVLLSGGKVAGVLLEAVDGALAVGVGLNLVAAPGADRLRPGGAPAAALVRAFAGDAAALRHNAMARLAARMAGWTALWAAAADEEVLRAWRAKAMGLGQRAAIDAGGETVYGVFAGISAEGALRLTPDGGGEDRLFFAGDASFSMEHA